MERTKTHGLTFSRRKALAATLLFAIVIPIIGHHIFYDEIVSLVLVLICSLVTLIPLILALINEFKCSNTIIALNKSELKKSQIYFTILAVLGLFQRLLLADAMQLGTSLLVLIPLTFLVIDELRTYKNIYIFNSNEINHHIKLTFVIVSILIISYFLSTSLSCCYWNQRLQHMSLALPYQLSKFFISLSIFPIFFLLYLVLKEKINVSQKESKLASYKSIYYIFNILASLILIIYSFFTTGLIREQIPSLSIILNAFYGDDYLYHFISNLVILISATLLLIANFNFSKKSEKEKLFLLIDLFVTICLTSILYNDIFKFNYLFIVLFSTLSYSILNTRSKKLISIYMSFMILNILFIVVSGLIFMFLCNPGVDELTELTYSGLISLIASIVFTIIFARKKKKYLEKVANQ